MTVWLDPRTRLATARLICLLDASSGERTARACVRAGADAIGVRGDGDASGWASGRALSVSTGNVSAAGDCDLVLLPAHLDGAAATRIVGRSALWGRWCASASDVDAAIDEAGLAWLLVDAQADDALQRAGRLLPLGGRLPWFAAGGVTPEEIDLRVSRGVRRVAMGRALAGLAAPEDAVERAADCLRRAWNDDPRSESLAIGAWGGAGGFAGQTSEAG